MRKFKVDVFSTDNGVVKESMTFNTLTAREAYIDAVEKVEAYKAGLIDYRIEILGCEKFTDM